MTATPTPTGKIRGSLRDVTPKLQNFVGAVKVTTPSGKGGLLIDMGRPVAAYLTRGGVLHKGKASLDLLEKEQLAEFEILRYDDEQFRDAMVICDNRGLLLGEEKGKIPAPAPSREGGEKAFAPGAVEQKESRGENVLSAMMKRFAAPKAQERPEPAQPAPGPGERRTAPATLPFGKEEERQAPGAVAPIPGMKPSPIPEKKEPGAAAHETELSAIIKRLRESGKIEKAPAQPPGRLEEILPAGLPESPAEAAKPSPPVPSRGGGQPPAMGEKIPEPAPSLGGIGGAPEGQEPVGRVKVDLGKMMKRIKRLDISSIRKELQEGAEAGGATPGSAAVPAPSPEEAAAPAGGQPAPAAPAEAKERSDMDELKAFIQRLEILEEPEVPPGKTLFAKLRAKTPAEEGPPFPAGLEIPVPAPEKPSPEAPPAEGVKAVEKPPVEREAPRPAEPDRKAKITSLLRRSGLVKPPVEEPAREPMAGLPPEAMVPEERAEPATPTEEAGIRVPRISRKKVEITRVPKRLEKPLREPPRIDESMIQRILKQPGVIAVSTFFDGFAVQSAGRADFEQVAANAEDLFRAGKKIAREIDIGPLNQIILETGKGKLIIAPYGDLNVCIFTKPDANLGLIRVAIKSMQVEQD